ncbi:acyltransferase family protein [Lunatibacter salilacus]|uniref:acyltransferase family protein n=1 Tax=Lunatibacter salilacus TaxID=2483804 RepID=UPI00131C548F|nr:acyltransferase family protein [Lunatibacter salilacus]
MRRYDLDWLRVIVFGLLIFYHVGMFFVPWGWHIKNDIIYPELRWPMLFVNQWRLSILFVISGMGTYYALSKRSGLQFSGERIKRLFIPLVFGMAFIVPPQVYFERLDKGQFSGGYLDFWPAYAFNGVYPAGNLSWHHLWFLPYLLVFSLVLVPVFIYLRNHPQAKLLSWVRTWAGRPFGLFWMVIPLYFWESLVEPFFESTHALVGDWFNLINYGTLFFYGFLLISVRETFWRTVEANRRKYLYLGIVAFSLMVGLRQIYADSTVVHFIEAAFKVINTWAWIMTLFGYAAAYLNRPSGALSYANEAVYPFYILHQTITIALGFYVMHLNWGLGAKFAFMSLGTFGFAWVLYEVGIRRWNWVRPLFGLKGIRHATQVLQRKVKIETGE